MRVLCSDIRCLHGHELSVFVMGIGYMHSAANLNGACLSLVDWRVKPVWQIAIAVGDWTKVYRRIVGCDVANMPSGRHR